MKNEAKRFEERKLNWKKVIGTIVIFALLIYTIFYLTKEVKAQKSQVSLSPSKYFCLYKDNLYGVVDDKGNVVINSYYKEMITIPNKAKDVFIVTYDVNYVTGDYKTKVVNQENKDILTQFTKVEPLTYMENGNVCYLENCLKFSNEENKVGLIDLDGNVIKEPTFDSIEPIYQNKNYFLTTLGGKSGVISSDGKEIIPNDYEKIEPLKGGNSFIVTNGKSGVIDSLGNIILPIEYDVIQNISTNDLFVIGQKQTLEIIDKTQTQVMASGIYDVVEIGRNVIYKNSSGKAGVKSLTGEDILKPNYVDIKQAYQDNFIVKETDKYGVISKDGTYVIPADYVNIEYNSKANIYICDLDEINQEIYDGNFEQQLDGIVLEQNEDYFKISKLGDVKYFDYTFEQIDENTFFENTLLPKKENSKYGFVDKKGNVVVDFKYDDITPQNEYGFIGVKSNGKWGVIDSEGKLLIDTIYNLDDYLNIDFVGKYHRGIDYSIEYFTDEDKA